MTSDLVRSAKSESNTRRQLSPEQAAAAAMVAEARERGLALTGPDGLLKLFTKNVLETALNEEMTEHLGHEKNRAEPGRESTNVRNGTRPKTVISDAAGEVDIEVPRDRESTFEPRIVKKRQRRLTHVDEIVLSLYAKGMTTGEISAHFAEIYGASVSRETISRITDKVIDDMREWASRPLDAVYAAVFVDAIVVKVRDGQVANRPFYAAIGVTVEGRKDVLGLWAGTGGEGAKFSDERARRLEKPGGERRVLPGLRRAQRPARGGRAGLARHDRPNLHHPSHPQLVPPDLPEGLGRDQTRDQTPLRSTQSRRRGNRLGRTR
jgi:transposase-like protein